MQDRIEDLIKGIRTGRLSFKHERYARQYGRDEPEEATYR